MPSPYASADKRAELIRAAMFLLHERGYERTTLANVADRAQVPIGNLYYYFKTKESLAAGVIAGHEQVLRAQLASWVTALSLPRLRLRRFVRAPLDAANAIVDFGCPHGSLCQEIEKLGPESSLGRAAARLLVVQIDWAESQFRDHGAGRSSRGLATDLVASLQGTMLLAHATHSRELLESQLRRLERWLHEVLSKHAPRSASD